MIQLKDICDIYDCPHTTAKDEGKGYPLVRTPNVGKGRLLLNGIHRVSEEVYNSRNSRAIPEEGDLILAREAPVGNVSIIMQGQRVCLGQRVVLIKPKRELVDPHYLTYYLLSAEVQNRLKNHANGAVVAHLNVTDIRNLLVSLPELDEQIAIGKILRSIEDKIELNNRINHNLLNLAQELFNNSIAENACCSRGWRSASLLDIAEYLNGLAMQKYPAINGEFSLPVLKIKELGQQACDANSDRCTESIPEQFIVKDGDIIFSWSGTLLVDFWCGGKCGLNQHLFKVSSDMYPNWFVYFWTKHHLDRFIRIAKDKAVTMGHIKRGDLGKAVVVIPEDAVMNKLNGEIAPLISECIERRIENRKLQSLRNSLLPKLMSGELKINDLTC